MEKKKSINLAELNSLINNDNSPLVIDVRSKEEFNQQHIPFAINLPLEKIEAKDANLDITKTIITVCGKGGGRSERATDFIRNNYIAKVFFLEGGTLGWFENEKLFY